MTVSEAVKAIMKEFLERMARLPLKGQEWREAVDEVDAWMWGKVQSFPEDSVEHSVLAAFTYGFLQGLIYEKRRVAGFVAETLGKGRLTR